MGQMIRDAALIETKALPNGAASTYTDAIDLGAMTSQGVRPENVEFEAIAPALTTVQQPDGKTTIYDVQMDDDSAFGSPTTLIDNIITQTGAGSAGAATQTKKFRIPSNCERYIRLAATGSTTGDNSASSMTLRANF